MTDYLKEIDPQQTVAILGVVVILRTIFGYLTQREKKESNKLFSATEVELQRIGQVLQSVGQHIERQTDIVKEVAMEMREFRKQMDGFREELDEFRSSRRECPNTRLPG